MGLAKSYTEPEPSAGRGFIVGAPRSGTTLLISLVAAHPEIAPIYETEFIRHLLLLCEQEKRSSTGFWRNEIYARVRRRLRSWRRAKRPDSFARKVLPSYRSPERDTAGKTQDEFFPFGNHCIEYNFCELIDETERFLVKLAAGDGGTNDPFVLARRYIDRLFAIHCSRMNRPFWVNKTPSLVRCLDLLHKMHPECALIHIVRDGRDVALSTVSLRTGPNNVRDAARRWREMVLRGRRLHDNSNYLEVRYEDLIAAPARVLKTVFGALGFDACAASNLPGLKVYGHREKVWRSGLAKKDKRDFAKEAGDLLIQLGYEKDNAWVS